ncbi:hypothetical protein [Bacteroides fragilis]|uniref:hypothetical protein n=1 Tax=Bacteroides fragilis TaxID=817 RepID=UPI0024557F0E|nr:hypothetical protein [Bacteroides fragilis]
MKKEEMNYEKWLEQLKKTPPVLENPDALTEDIMRAVKAAPFRNRPVRRLNFAAWCSAIAATLLLGLWVAEAVAVDPILSSEVTRIPKPYQEQTLTDERSYERLMTGEKREIFFSASRSRKKEMLKRERLYTRYDQIMKNE